MTKLLVAFRNFVNMPKQTNKKYKAMAWPSVAPRSQKHRGNLSTGSELRGGYIYSMAISHEREITYIIKITYFRPPSNVSASNASEPTYIKFLTQGKQPKITLHFRVLFSGK